MRPAQRILTTPAIVLVLVAGATVHSRMSNELQDPAASDQVPGSWKIVVLVIWLRALQKQSCYAVESTDR